MTRRLSTIILLIMSLYVTLSMKAQPICKPLKADSLIALKCIRKYVNGESMISSITLGLIDGFEGKIWMYDTVFSDRRMEIDVITVDSVVHQQPIFGADQRYCMLLFDPSIRQADLLRMEIPSGFFEIDPDDYLEVDSIDIDEESLSGFSVAGA